MYFIFIYNKIYSGNKNIKGVNLKYFYYLICKYINNNINLYKLTHIFNINKLNKQISIIF